MKGKKILGAFLLVIGFCLIALSMYITDQVEAGAIRASDAQSKVDFGKRLFSLHPVTKEVGGYVTHPMQEKINEGIQQIGDYKTVAKASLIGGFILVGIGVILLLIPRRGRL